MLRIGLTSLLMGTVSLHKWSAHEKIFVKHGSLNIRVSQNCVHLCYVITNRPYWIGLRNRWGHVSSILISPSCGRYSDRPILESFRHNDWGRLSEHQLQNSSAGLLLPQQQRSDLQEHTWILVHPCRTSWCRHFQKDMAEAHRSSWSKCLQEGCGNWDTSK